MMITLKLFLCLAPLYASSGMQSMEPSRLVPAVSIEQATEVSTITRDTVAESTDSHEKRVSLDVTEEHSVADPDSSTAVIAVTQREVHRKGDDRKDDDDADDKGDRNEDRPDRRDGNGPGDRGPDSHRGPDNQGPGFGGGFGPRGFGGPPGGFGGGPFGGGFGGSFGGMGGGLGSREVSSSGASVDSNRNGKLEEDELSRIPKFVQEMLKSRGIQLEPGMAAEGLHFSFRANFHGNAEERGSESQSHSNGPGRPNGPPGPMAFKGPMGPPNVQNPAGPHGPAGMNVSNVIFELLDLNHDGSLSRDEFQRLTEAIQKTQHAAPAIHRPMNLPHLRGPELLRDAPGHDRRPPMNRAMGPESDVRHPEMNRHGDGPRPEPFIPENGRPEFRRPSRPEQPPRESRPPAGRRDDDREDEDEDDESDHQEGRTEITTPEQDAAVVAQPGLSGDWI